MSLTQFRTPTYPNVVSAHEAVESEDSFIKFFAINNISINTTIDAWDYGNIQNVLNIQTVDSDVTVESSSTQDSYPSGTGAQVIQVRGLSDGKLLSEVVQLNGQSPVTLTNQFSNIHRIIVFPPIGSSGSTDGTLVCTHIDSGEVMAVVMPGGDDNQTLMSHFVVPENYSAIIKSVDASCNKGGDASFKLKTRLNIGGQLGPWNTSYIMNPYQSAYQRSFHYGGWLPPLTQIKVETETTTNGVDITGSYELLLRKYIP